MKPYMLAIAGTVLVGLLLVVGFGGGNWIVVVAIVLIAAICWATGLLVGRDSVTDDTQCEQVIPCTP